MITLPYRLGGIVRDAIDAYRRANNIPEPQEVKDLGVHRRRDTFLESEFELVKSLEVDKDLLEYIELFPSVTSITIDGSKGLNQFEINDLIKKYPNLEKLIVKGQPDLQCLDVSKLQNLQHLEFVSNRQLHRVIGLDKLPNLSSLTFYDNETYLKEEELCEAVSKLIQGGTHCNFDVLYMPTLQKIGISAPDNISWCESVGLKNTNELKYSTEELEEAVRKAQEIVKNYIKPTDTPKQKFAILYQWMCENVKYDHEGLENNSTYSVNGQNMGQKGGTNGTVNGLVYGSCVCEGYSKAMQMLLKLSGLPSFDVTCITKEENKARLRFDPDNKAKKHEGDHSILKVNIDGICYYSDVTWDAQRYQNGEERKYFLMSWNDISKNHKLVYEDRVFAANKTVSNEEFQQLIQFAQERIKTVDRELEEQRKTPQERLSEINQQVESLRQQYGVIGSQMEDLMRRNAQAPIPNFQEQLNRLIQQRDSLNESISFEMENQRIYQNRIAYDEEVKHKAVISQVENLFGMRITDSAGYEVDPQKYGGVPRVVPKDTSTLRNEQGMINQQLQQLYQDGKLDVKTYQSMLIEVGKEYRKFIEKAPKPVDDKKTSQPTTQTSTQPQDTTPKKDKERTPYISPEVREKVEYRKRFGYDTMTDEEKREFDERLDRDYAQQKKKVTPSQDKEKRELEEQRRELRRNQFRARAESMGLDEYGVDLESIFREQEIIEQSRRSVEEVVERTGRRL